MKVYKSSLNEALSIDDEYKKNWSSIDRETFDKLIILDPKTNIEKNVIGFITKQLILPKVKEGENISDIEDDITDAINNCLTSSSNWPKELRNVGIFPTVHDFVDYALNGDESEFIKKFEAGEIKQAVKVEKNPIDDIYNQYYSDIDRSIFDKIIEADPDTNKKSIGAFAKNLLLPKYKTGEKDFISKLDEIKNAIIYFKNNLNEFKKEHQNITSFNSVQEFLNLITSGEESELLTYLKNCPEWHNIRYIGSTKLYDIFEPLSLKAAAYIAGADYAVGGPGITSNGSRNYGGRGNTSARSNVYAHWCTTTSSYYDNYRSANGENNGKYYDFMAKGSRLKADDRTHNYQLAITKSGYLIADADGFENFGRGDEMKQLFGEDPTISEVLAKENGYAANLPQVKQYINIKKYGDKPYEYTGSESLKEIKSNSDYQLIKGVIKEISVSEEVKEIPALEFVNWTTLHKINFSESNNLKKIGSQSFKNCTALQRLDFPEGLEYIGAQAFKNCTSLKGNTRLPKSLQKIDLEAFSNTGDLQLTCAQNHSKIQVNKQDISWFAKHLRTVQVSEELDKNMLNENIPDDLVKAYRNSEIAVRGIQAHPTSQHDEIANRNRTPINWKYAEATYSPMSAEEALDYLGIEYQINTADDGDYTIKARTTNREDFNNKISNLRIIIDNKVIEYEVRGGNVLYLAYWMIIPTSKFGNYPFFKGKDGSLTTDVRFATKYSDLVTVLKIADKIYKTDEYDHPNTNLNRGKTYFDDNSSDVIHGVENTKQTKRNDTGSHTYNDYYQYNTSWNSDNATPVVKDIKLYNNLLKLKNKLYINYNLVRKSNKKLNVNRDAYEEDDFNELSQFYTQKLTEINKRYNKVAKEVAALKSRIKTYFNEDFIRDYNERKEREKRRQEEINAKLSELRGLQNKLYDVSTATIEDTHAYQQAKRNIENAEEKINTITKAQNSIREQNEKYRAQIEELTRLIAAGEEKEAENAVKLNDSIQALEQAKAEATNVEQKAVVELVKAEKEYTAQIEEIENWFDANTDSNYAAKRPVKRELNDTQNTVLDVVEEPEEVASEEDSIDNLTEDDKMCKEKFGFTLDQIKKMCHINIENRYVTDNVDMVDPFSDVDGEPHDTWTYDEMLNYWLKDDYTNKEEIEDTIRKIVSNPSILAKFNQENNR